VLEDVALRTGGGNVASDPEHYRRGHAACRRDGCPGRRQFRETNPKE
jgi:hypothetical protein